MACPGCLEDVCGGVSCSGGVQYGGRNNESYGGRNMSYLGNDDEEDKYGGMM